MIASQKTIGWTVTGFRRYRPEERISRGMVTAAPWVSIALLIGMYLFFLMPWVLQPGVQVRLPESPFATGTRYGHNVVVLSQAVAGRPERQEIIYFDDQRYRVSDRAQMDDLRAALARSTELPMIIEADTQVSHGTIVQLFNMAADAGIREVNLATQPGQAR